MFKQTGEKKSIINYKERLWATETRKKFTIRSLENFFMDVKTQ